MGAVTLTSDWPPADGPLTVADLERTPDDGRRYELVDGVLIVSPAPLIPHQVVLHELAVLLDASLPEDLAVVPGVGVRMSDTTELVPDLVVVHRADLAGRKPFRSRARSRTALRCCPGYLGTERGERVLCAAGRECVPDANRRRWWRVEPQDASWT